MADMVSFQIKISLICNSKNFQYQFNGLMEACQKEVKEVMHFNGDSLMAAILVAELVGDKNLKKTCLGIVKRFVLPDETIYEPFLN
jgi:hypothetical protein